MQDLHHILEELKQVDILVASNKITRSVSPDILPKPTPSPQMAPYVAMILANSGYSVTNDFVTFLADLAVDYLHGLLESVKKLSEIQRRTKPSLNDVRYACKLGGISYSELYDHAISKQNKRKFLPTKTAGATAGQEQEDESTGTSYEISKILPNHFKPRYIPSYLPDFPPQFTYQSTADYMPTITDLERLRIKLVEESRLTEKSLYGLIGDEKLDESDVESVMSLDMSTPPPRFEESRPPELPEYAVDDFDEETVRVAAPKPEVKQFDVLKYVKNRVKNKNQLVESVEHIRLKRHQSIYMEAEKYLSPYAEEQGAKFSFNLDEELEKVINSVKTSQKRIRVEVERLQNEKKQRREEMENKETIEFNFHSESEGEEPDFGDFGPIFDEPAAVPVQAGVSEELVPVELVPVVPVVLEEPVEPMQPGAVSVPVEPMETGEFDDFEDEFEDIMGDIGDTEENKGDVSVPEAGESAGGDVAPEAPKLKLKLTLK